MGGTAQAVHETRRSHLSLSSTLNVMHVRLVNVVSNRYLALIYKADNDPNAGSPTITLLRLLLPLGRTVIWTLVAVPAYPKANREPHPPNP